MPKPPRKRKPGAQPKSRNASPFSEPTVRLPLRIPISANAILQQQCALTNQSPSVIVTTLIHQLKSKP